MELIRAFIAIEVSKLFKDATHEVAYELARILPSNTIRFANSNATHITLNFIGQMDINAGHAVHKAMIRSASAAYPFDLSIGQLGGFPSNEMPRIVWVAFGGGLDALGTLQRALSDELESLGMQRQTSTALDRPSTTSFLDRVCRGVWVGLKKEGARGRPS